jgi:hypothetical protein
MHVLSIRKKCIWINLRRLTSKVIQICIYRKVHKKALINVNQIKIKTKM